MVVPPEQEQPWEGPQPQAEPLLGLSTWIPHVCALSVVSPRGFPMSVLSEGSEKPRLWGGSVCAPTPLKSEAAVLWITWNNGIEG